jgi:hypothetical protein
MTRVTFFSEGNCTFVDRGDDVWAASSDWHGWIDANRDCDPWGRHVRCYSSRWRSLRVTVTMPRMSLPRRRRARVVVALAFAAFGCSELAGYDGDYRLADAPTDAASSDHTTPSDGTSPSDRTTPSDGTMPVSDAPVPREDANESPDAEDASLDGTADDGGQEAAGRIQIAVRVSAWISRAKPSSEHRVRRETPGPSDEAFLTGVPGSPTRSTSSKTCKVVRRPRRRPVQTSSHATSPTAVARRGRMARRTRRPAAS